MKRKNLTGSQKPARHRRRRRGLFCKARESHLQSTMVISLRAVPIGEYVQIVNFSPRVTRAQQAYLHAYGVAPGHNVRVLQQSPVTVVQVDHLELAMEHNLAREISVMQGNTKQDSQALTS